MSFLLRHRSLLLLFLALSLGGYVGQAFIIPLLWAALLSISIWPLYRQFCAFSRKLRLPRFIAPLLSTLVVGLLLFAPLFWVVSTAHDELRLLLSQASPDTLVSSLRNHPILAQLSTVPLLGPVFSQWWLSQPVHRLFDQLQPDFFLTFSRSFGGALLSFLFSTLLSLFFLFLFLFHGAHLRSSLRQHIPTLLGSDLWSHFQEQATLARSIFNGFVALGLIEGLLFWRAYDLAGAHQPALLGFLTGVLSAIPLLSPLIAAAVSALLFFHSGAGVAIGLALFSGLILFVADPIIRPLISGRHVSLPFWLTFLAIVAGIQTLGLLGLYLGPMLAHFVRFLWLLALRRPPPVDGL